MLKLLKTFVVFQRSKTGNYNLLITSLVLCTITPLLNHVLAPYLYADFISNLEQGVALHDLTWQNAIGVGVIGYVSLICGSYIIQTCESYIISYLESRTMENIDNATVKHIFSLSIDFFKNNFTGSLVSKQNAFANNYERLFDTIYWEIIPTIVIVLGTLPVIFSYSWILGSIMFLYIVIYILMSRYMSRRIHTLQAEFTESRTVHAGMISDQIGNIQTIKFFGRDKDEVNRYAQWNKKKAKLRITTWLKDQKHRTITNGTIMLMNTFTVIACYMLWINGKIDIGGVILMITYNGRISDRMWNIGNIIKTLRTIRADATEMLEILEIQPTIVDADDTVPCDISAGQIECNNITFSYKGSNVPVFENFSLRIPAGQKVGIVGKSGSGKSTLMHLLMRMMDIQSGEITIDGIPINRVKQLDLRQSMSIVPQDTVLFHRTVFENIAYDKPGATLDEVIIAAQKAQAHDFIVALTSGDERGYNVKVGERGIKLSGGQRQRIGLARAFLQHKPLLILDEATSSLDSISERKIQRGLDNLLHEQGTMIIIAHRLSTVQQLDRIIVMDHGKIIEDGTHEELYSILGGTYRSLVDAQQLLVD